MDNSNKDSKSDFKGGYMEMDLNILKVKSNDSHLINLIFILPNKKDVSVFVNKGESILDIAKKNNLPLEGACGGSLACSTCHVVIEESFFKDELAKKSDLEEDMLDMVSNIKRTSRLGCQVIVQEWMEGMKIYLYDDGNFYGSSCCEGCCCK